MNVMEQVVALYVEEAEHIAFMARLVDVQLVLAQVFVADVKEPNMKIN